MAGPQEITPLARWDAGSGPKPGAGIDGPGLKDNEARALFPALVAASILRVSGPDAGLALSRHVAALSRTRTVLIVSCRAQTSALRAALAAAAADLRHIFILEVATQLAAATAPPNSPKGSLAPILHRARNVLRLKAERLVTVIVDDAQCFLRYASPEEVLEILPLAVETLPGNEQQYVVSDGPLPSGFLARVRALIPDEVTLEPQETVPTTS